MPFMLSFFFQFITSTPVLNIQINLTFYAMEWLNVKLFRPILAEYCFTPVIVNGVFDKVKGWQTKAGSEAEILVIEALEYEDVDCV